MKWYIIEHPTRGVFVGSDYDPADGTPKFHFSNTASRSDERTEKFFHLRPLADKLSKMPTRVRDLCFVLSLERMSGERYPEIQPVPEDQYLPILRSIERSYGRRNA